MSEMSFDQDPGGAMMGGGDPYGDAAIDMEAPAGPMEPDPMLMQGEMPTNEPQDEMPGACPECGAPMEGNVCQHCGYSHETPVPPENLPEPSMSAKCGIELGRVIMHIATQAIATPVTDPEALKGLGAAAKDFASALKDVSPPPSTVDPTTAEKIAQQDVDAERSAELERERLEHEAAEKEADHERAVEQAEVQHEQGLESTEVQQALQAEQQAAQQGSPGQQSS
jgi:hypothetical protein